MKILTQNRQAEGSESESKAEITIYHYRNSNSYFYVLTSLNRDIDNFVEGFINEITDKFDVNKLEKYKHRMSLIFKMPEKIKNI